MAQAGSNPTTSDVVVPFPRSPLTARERIVAAAILGERAAELDEDLAEMEGLAQHAATVLEHLQANIAKFQRQLGR